MELPISKGVWDINPKATRNVRCGNITIANCSSGQNGDNEEEEIANAKLIADAGTTANRCNKLPSTLLIENTNMKSHLEMFIDILNNPDSFDLVWKLKVKENAEQLLAKINK